MFASLKTRTMTLALLTAALAFSGSDARADYRYTGSAAGSSCHSSPKVVGYRTVKQPVAKWVTRYRPCGTPFRVKVVSYRYVQVAVYRSY